MTSPLRVLIEGPTRGKRWVAVEADRPGLERGAKTEDEAVEKLGRHAALCLPAAKRARLGSEPTSPTDVDIIGRYTGRASRSASGRCRTCSATRPMTCSTTPGRCRTGT